MRILLVLVFIVSMCAGCASYDKSTFIRIKAKKLKGNFEQYTIDGEGVAATINRQVYLTKDERETPDFQSIKETSETITVGD